MPDRALLQAFTTTCDRREYPSWEILDALAARFPDAPAGQRASSEAFTVHKKRGRRPAVAHSEIAAWFFWLRSVAPADLSNEQVRDFVAEVVGMSSETVRNAVRAHMELSQVLANSVEAMRQADPRKFAARLRTLASRQGIAPEFLSGVLPCSERALPIIRTRAEPIS